MPDFKISVAMCTYNGSKYLPQQLDSILSQTLLPDQIVIIDDNSQDNTRDIIEKYSREHGEIEFLIEKNPKNMGYVANFLRAARIASGDIIFMADQDDIWHKTKISEIVDVFRKNEKALSVNCAYDLIDGEGKKIVNKLAVRQKLDGKTRNVPWRKYIISPRYLGNTLAIKKELLHYLPEKPIEKSPDHDWLLEQTAAYRGGMFYYGKILASYRQHSSNTTAGVIKCTTASQLLENRRKIICGFTKAHLTLKQIYPDNSAIQKWTDKLLKIDQTRIKNVENKNLVLCALTYLLNFRNISLRCFMGDMYTILKLKTNR